MDYVWVPVFLWGIQYGAKNYKALERQISTTMISGVVFSFVLTIICLLFAKPILMLLQVDQSIFTMTTEYMRIIFLGLMFTLNITEWQGHSIR